MSFDRIAPFYGFISQLVFGQSLRKAKSCYLSAIGSEDSILIIGGGNGDILPKLPLDSRKTFIDSSSAMLQLAKERNCMNVEYVHQSIATFQSSKQFDVIIMNCFLDLFDEHELPEIVSTIKPFLKSGGRLLVTDFSDQRVWHRMMLSTMYLFFSLTAGITNRKLCKWQEALSSIFHRVDQRKFYGNFIISERYTS